MTAAAVTPAGVRDGHPDALAGVCARRGPAVLAYCERVAGERHALVATAEAFRRFRAAVVAASDPTDLNPEALLISTTRHAAAGYVPRPPELPDALRLAARRPATGWCGDTAALLAARADRKISTIDRARLEQHLVGCPACRAPQARFEAAERAYRNPPETPLPLPVTAAVMAALAAAAPASTRDAAAAAAANGAGADLVAPIDRAEPVAPGTPALPPPSAHASNGDPASAAPAEPTADVRRPAQPAITDVQPSEPVVGVAPSGSTPAPPPDAAHPPQPPPDAATVPVAPPPDQDLTPPEPWTPPPAATAPSELSPEPVAPTEAGVAQPVLAEPQAHPPERAGVAQAVPIAPAAPLAAIDPHDSGQTAEYSSADLVDLAASDEPAQPARDAGHRRRIVRPSLPSISLPSLSLPSLSLPSVSLPSMSLPKRPARPPREPANALPRPQRTGDASTHASASPNLLHRRRPAALLPAALIVLAIVIAMAIAGVFGGGGEAESPTSSTPTPTTRSGSGKAPKDVPGAGSDATAIEAAKARARARVRRDAQRRSGSPASPQSAGGGTRDSSAAPTPPP